MHWLKPEPNAQPSPAIPIADAFKGTAMMEFNSPFKKENLKSVWLWIDKGDNGGATFRAWVNYKNKSSEGKHELIAETFQGLVDNVNVFINGMP